MRDSVPVCVRRRRATKTILRAQTVPASPLPGEECHAGAAHPRSFSVSSYVFPLYHWRKEMVSYVWVSPTRLDECPSWRRPQGSRRHSPRTMDSLASRKISGSSLMRKTGVSCLCSTTSTESLTFTITNSGPPGGLCVPSAWCLYRVLGCQHEGPVTSRMVIPHRFFSSNSASPFVQ